MTVRSWMVIALMATVTPVAAHHSAAAAYDESKRVEAQGTVTRVMLRNPHSWVFLDGVDEKGQKVEWQIEMAAAASLNWTPDTLPIGTVVRVTLEGTDRSVVVVINDRPGTRTRIIDLSPSP